MTEDVSYCNETLKEHGYAEEISGKTFTERISN